MTSPVTGPGSAWPPPIDGSDPRLFGPLPAAGGVGTSLRLRPTQVLLAIQLGAALVALWPLVLAVRGPQPLALAPLLAHVAGMLAGFGVVVLLALMSRAPALERGVGADVLTRWHGYGGRLVVGLVLVHAWAAVLSWQQSRQENALITLWQVLGLPGLVSTTESAWILWRG